MYWVPSLKVKTLFSQGRDQQMIFKELNTNNDGMLSKYDLTVVFQYMHGKQAADVVDQYFEYMLEKTKEEVNMAELEGRFGSSASLEFNPEFC